MSHNILENDSIVAIEKTWHGLEKIVPAITLENSGLDWLVTEKPVFCKVGENLIEMPDYKTLVRQSDFFPIHLTNKTYEVIQNQRIFEAIETSLTGVNHKIVTTGSLGNLTKIFVSVALEGKQDYVVNGDSFKNFLTFVTSHDGSLAFKVYDTAIRVVCQNTLNLSMRNQGNVSLRVSHTKNSEIKIQNMEKSLETLFVKREEFYLSYDRLMMESMSLDVANKVLMGFMNEGKKEVSTRTANQIDEILHLFKNGKGNNGKTKADLLNGVTEYYTKYSSNGNAKQYGSSEFGSGAKAKAEFVDAIINDAMLDQLTKQGEKLLAQAITV